MFLFQAHAEDGRMYGPERLTSSLITCIEQDETGYIWIGTEYGLNKYDGISFTEYYNDELDPGSLMSNSIRTLFCDDEGRLWIGFLTGMQMYDPYTDTFKTVDFPGTSYTPNISHIIQLASGKIWMIAARLGIYELDPDRMTAHKVNEITTLCKTDHINHFMQDAHGRLWLASAESGIFCIEKDLKSFSRHFPSETEDRSAARLAVNKNGIVTAAFEGRIWLFDEVQQIFIPLQQSDGTYLDVRDMLLRTNGDLLIAAYNEGILKVDEAEKSLVSVSMFPNPVSLMEDREGNLWCGHFHSGALMIPPPASEQGFKYMDIGHGSVTAMCKDTDGNLHVGSQDGTISIVRNNSKVTDIMVANGTPTCFFEDSRGTIWCGIDYRGVTQIGRNDKSIQRLDELNHTRVMSITEGPDGILYIGTLGSGIWTYDISSGKCMKLTSEDPENFKLLRNSYINKLFIDSKERLWIGHFLGASCYDIKTGRFLDIATDGTLNISVGYAIEEGNDGKIWIGTNNGLFSWHEDSGKYRRYTANNGLTSNMICGLAKDRDGNIWCSTFNGINCMIFKSGQIVGFNVSDQESKTEYTQRSYFNDGSRIYFGGGNGITHFVPPIITENIERNVYLTNIFVGADKVIISDDTKEIKLDSDQNTFTLEFSSFAIREAENIRFSYRISELDQEWHITRPGTNQITYNNLRPGSYTLEAGTFENGFQSPARQWTIRIERPWYSSIAASTIYIILFTGIIILGIYIVRRHKIQKVNEQRLKYYVNFAHEVRSPMVMIKNPIDKLLKMHSDPETRHTLITMKRNSERIIRMLNRFLDIRKIDKGQMTLQMKETDIVELVRESLGAFTYEAESRNIMMDFEHPLEKIICNIDPHHMDSVISNLLTNALKHTPDNGEILVKLYLSSEYGYVELTVTDSGQGIEEKNLEAIFKRFFQVQEEKNNSQKGFGVGLNLCQMLVEMHNGRISAGNRTDGKSGAVFTVCLPVGHTDMNSGTSRNMVHTFINDNSKVARKERKARVKTGYKILVIEDDEEIRMYLKDTLFPSYKVLTAKDGNAGLKTALTELPDLIISDVIMPGTDGFQVVKKIKDNLNTTHIPVLLLTSKADISDRLAGIEHGADAYMVKPFNIDELHLTIQNLLKNRQRIKGKYSGSFQEDRIRTIDIKSNSDKLMERIMKVINDNLDNPDLKVEKLAEEVGLSRAQLHRRVKEMTGASTGEFIRNIRLKKAAELLNENKVNISQVAYMVGFSSQTHFSTAFRKLYGISPTEYISRNG